MGINLIAPGSASPTGALFYDTGSFGSVPTMTKVGAVPVSAAVEIQSTLGALLLPRMTTAQRNALVTVVDGMEVYDSTVGSVFTRAGSAWVQSAGAQGVQYVSGTLTAAQVNSLYTLGISLIAAQGAHTSIIIQGLALERVSDGTAFTGGGNITLQFTTTTHAGGIAVTPTIPATFLTAAAAAGVSLYTFVSGASLAATNASYVNTPVCIAAATADFAAGGASTVNWKIWYSVIPTN